ncbi:MAG TPA: DUF58 domain-containing protein [Myxococcales bacterium]|nr:DUF58 domain-containing protein [Myxococcales bacterium]
MSFRPGQQLAKAMGAAALLAAGGALFAPLAFIGAGALLALVLLALLEGFSLRRATVSVEREDAFVPLGAREIFVAKLWHDFPGDLRLTARTLWPAELGGGSSSSRGLCRPGEQLELRFEATGLSRGEATLPPLHIAMTRFGLAERLVEAGQARVVRVLPDFAAVQRMHARLNALYLRGQGTRLSPRAGQGREFDRLRDYVPGDDFRQLAWKASARQRKLIVREFRIERSQDVLLCIDRGHRMAARVGPYSRADHAVNAAMLAAYVCSRSEDRTGLLSFSAQVDNGVAPGRGSAHLGLLSKFATKVAVDFLHSDYRALAAHVRRRLRSRSLILLMTVVPERGEHHELLEAVRMMMPRHLPLIVALRDEALEAAAQSLPASRRELSRTLVATGLTQGRSQLLRELRQLGALVVESTPQDSGIAAVNAYLDVKRRQLL